VATIIGRNHLWMQLLSKDWKNKWRSEPLRACHDLRILCYACTVMVISNALDHA